MAILFIVEGEGVALPATVLALMSYPAGLLANTLPIEFPVRFERFSAVPLWPLFTAGFGFAQWVLFVPWVSAKIMEWHRSGIRTRAHTIRKMAADILILLVTWFFSEVLAILISIPLNPLTHRLVRYVGAVAFHLWLAIPLTVTAALAGAIVVRVFHTEGATRWLVALVSLFLCAGALQAAILLTGRIPSGASARRADHVGSIVQALTPALMCSLVGVSESRRRKAPRAA